MDKYTKAKTFLRILPRTLIPKWGVPKWGALGLETNMEIWTKLKSDGWHVFSGTHPTCFFCLSFFNLCLNISCLGCDLTWASTTGIIGRPSCEGAWHALLPCTPIAKNM